MADGVEDPVHCNAAAVRLPGERLINRREFLLLPQDHSRGEVDLGIGDAFTVEPVEQCARDEGVILRRRQTPVDPNVTAEKAVEIHVGGCCTNLLGRQRWIEFKKSLGLNRSLQVNVQLGDGRHSCHNSGRWGKHLK
jgi:hypothetical protein